MMKRFLLAVSLFLAFSTVAAAQCKDGQCRNPLSTAQGVAERMARLMKVGHFGGNPYSHEGCGMGMTREQAYRNCCYSNSGMKTMDVGYAQDSRGRWYCCRRYSR